LYGILAVFLLALSLAVHVTVFVAARHAVGTVFPQEKHRSVSFRTVRGVGGVAAWYLAGSVLFTVGILGRGETVVDETSMRVLVSSSGPAARAGLRDGDQIVSVAREQVTSWDQLRGIVARHGDEAIPIEIKRGDQTLTLPATPEGSPPKLRVGPWSEERSVSVGRAIAQGLVAPGGVVGGTIRSVARILGGDPPQAVGAAGIVRETSSAARHGFLKGLLLATLITSYLLPLLALGTAIYEFLDRRHELARLARLR
jgi:membrane-associated protease RseP (regulator of RpoE activity)